MGLDEQRSDEHEHPQPGRVGKQLPERPAHDSRLRRGPCAVRPPRSQGESGRRRERAASPARDSTSGTTIHDRRQLTSPAAPPSGMPTIQASGGPSSATASTRERSSGRLHSATAATAAEYVSPTPMPIGTWASASTAKSGATALRRDPTASRTSPAERRAPAAPHAPRGGRREHSGHTGREPRDRAQLSGGRGRDAEVGRDDREDRREDEKRGLRGGETEAERRRRRAPVAHQTMIGTVPPSALQAAPVT